MQLWMRVTVCLTKEKLPKREGARFSPGFASGLLASLLASFVSLLSRVDLLQVPTTHTRAHTNANICTRHSGLSNFKWQQVHVERKGGWKDARSGDTVSYDTHAHMAQREHATPRFSCDTPLTPHRLSCRFPWRERTDA